MKTTYQDINLTQLRVAIDTTVRSTYWAILDQYGQWVPASLHFTRSGSIRRGMQICFPTDHTKKTFLSQRRKNEPAHLETLQALGLSLPACDGESAEQPNTEARSVLWYAGLGLWPRH